MQNISGLTHYLAIQRGRTDLVYTADGKMGGLLNGSKLGLKASPLMVGLGLENRAELARLVYLTS